MRHFLLQLVLISAASAAQGLSLSVIELSEDEISRFGIVVDLIQRTKFEPGERESLSFTADVTSFSRCGAAQVVVVSRDALGNVVFSSIVGESQGLHYFQIRDDFIQNTELYLDCRPAGSGYVPIRYSFNLAAAVGAI